jgi:hypothetical protein
MILLPLAVSPPTHAELNLVAGHPMQTAGILLLRDCEHPACTMELPGGFYAERIAGTKPVAAISVESWLGPGEGSESRPRLIIPLQSAQMESVVASITTCRALP